MVLLAAVLICAQVPDAGRTGPRDRDWKLSGLVGKAPVLVGSLAPAVSLAVAPAKPPRELITVDGTPGLTAFVDKDQVGLRDGKRLLAWALPAPLEGDVGSAFTVPGRPDQFMACLDRDCSSAATCNGLRAGERSRQCVWLAPKCGAAVLLTPRFSRVEPQGQTLRAEVFATPACLLSDGPEPRWRDSSGAVFRSGPGSVLQGELETHACAPPSWLHTTGAARWSPDAGQPEPLRDVPRCDGG